MPSIGLNGALRPGPAYRLDSPDDDPPDQQGQTAFDWLPAAAWKCPRCSAEIQTRELAVRCPKCGYREAAD